MSGWRLALAMGLAAYTVLLMATLSAMQRPAEMGLRAVRRPAGASVTWVLPASGAWDAGVRPGALLPTGWSAPAARTLMVWRSDGRRVLLDPERSRLPLPAAVAILIVGGLTLLGAGSAIARTNGSLRARRLMAPFLVAGTGLTAVPATSASQGWALTLTFVCLLALGPAFLTASLDVAGPSLPARWRMGRRTRAGARAGGGNTGGICRRTAD